MDTKKILKCPACGNFLTKIKLGNVFVDICEGACGGIWFDQFEMDKFNETKEKKGAKLLNIKIDPNLSVDKTAKHICPVCKIEMFNYTLSLGKPFIVDECPDCGGFWLDGGEFEMLRFNSDIANFKDFNIVLSEPQYSAPQKSFLTKLHDLFSN